MTLKKSVLVALLAAFVATVAFSGDALAQKKKRRKKADPEARFKQLDKNDDKHLSKEEFVGRSKGKRKDRAEQQWEKFTSDKKKGMTFEEFKKATTRPKKKRKKKGDA